MRRWMIGLLGSLLLVTAGCSTSTWLLDALYSSADEQILHDLKAYTDYTPKQQRWLERSVQDFHLWHRRQELPRYAQWLEHMAHALEGKPTLKQVQTWRQQGTTFVQRLPECSPLSNAAPWLVQLSDRQVRDFERHLAKELAEEREEHADEPRAERLRERQANIEKWLGRIGLPMTDTQRASLQQTLQQSRSLREQWLALQAQWQARFIELLKARHQAKGEEAIQAHLNQLGGQLARHYPKQWQYNQDLWTQFAWRYLSEQPSEQRQSLREWLLSLSETLRSMSRTSVNDASDQPPAAPC